MNELPTPADHLGLVPYDDPVWAMQNLGFQRYYRQGLPAEEAVRAVEEAYEQAKKYHESPTLHCLGDEECVAFLRSNAPGIEGTIERALGMEFQNIVRQPPAIFRGESSQSSFRMAHLAGLGSATIVVYPGTHQDWESFMSEPTAPYEVTLHNTQLLVVAGQTFVEILMLANAFSPFAIPLMVFHPWGRS
ncbi:hypothetical protein BDV37DRAFT_276630 [Aspergillus pseudonomiae]|uniref:Uncharacterized protein n=1 Tax=Aspergillus pseudonomiae TaxID=1506151 RepID=A0A5N7CUE1_9EURO|nr:uncharacterized protein BDV37DRAFT_276630 [Aspergillus pseudonomiae]KAE8397815.1 hypothetical protein BDV37DRAFT_276630 [Aspergillus pseudonomiae]